MAKKSESTFTVKAGDVLNLVEPMSVAPKTVQKKDGSETEINQMSRRTSGVDADNIIGVNVALVATGEKEAGLFECLVGDDGPAAWMGEKVYVHKNHVDPDDPYNTAKGKGTTGKARVEQLEARIESLRKALARAEDELLEEQEKVENAERKVNAAKAAAAAKKAATKAEENAEETPAATGTEG